MECLRWLCLLSSLEAALTSNSKINSIFCIQIIHDACGHLGVVIKKDNNNNNKELA